MRIINSLHKTGVICACGCDKELPRRDPVSRINGKYYDLFHGKAYRLRVALVRALRGNV